MPRPLVEMQEQSKGVELRHRDGYQVTPMSWMDAAELLWDLKAKLQRSRIGRDCIDEVHARHVRERKAPERGEQR